MFFECLVAIILGILFLNGCAGNTVYKSRSSLLSDIGFYDTDKEPGLEGVIERDNIRERAGSTFGKKSLFAEEMSSGFFFLGPDSQTWRAYYYFFHIRKRIFQDFPRVVPEGEYDIPVVLNDKVQSFLVYFQTTGRDSFSQWLSRSGKYIPMMKEILESREMPLDLVYLAMIESGFNVRARSRKGAVGPWQFIESTAKRYGLRVDSWIDERMDPEKSTIAAADYLRDLYNMFESWELAAAGYNAGEDRVKSAIERSKASDFWEISEYTLPQETKDYVPKLIAALIIAKNPEKYGFTEIEYQEPKSFEQISVPPQRSLRDIAMITGIDYERLKDLNPSLIRGSTPPDDPYEINVPIEYREVVAAKQGEIDALEKVVVRSDLIKHRVKRGDTIGRIAARYGVSVSTLKSANRIRGSSIKIGQVLTIPRGSGGTYVRDESRKIASKKNDNKSGTYMAGMKYEVRRGDTPYKIASQFGVGVSSLIKLNKKSDFRSLKVGEMLLIPPMGSVGFSSNGNKASQKSDSKNVINYRVKRGDTLSDIASKYDVSVSQIKKWNNLKSSKLAAGDKLRIYAE